MNVPVLAFKLVEQMLDILLKRYKHHLLVIIIIRLLSLIVPVVMNLQKCYNGNLLTFLNIAYHVSAYS